MNIKSNMEPFISLLHNYWRCFFYPVFCVFLFAGCQDSPVEPTYYGSVSGTVLDARTNQPLANATITTSPATSSYLTNAAGKFQIDNAPAGRFAITATKADYTQVTTNVTVTNSTNADVAILLSKATTASIASPTRPSPANQTTGQPTTLLLGWRPPANSVLSDSLRYDVSLFESSSSNPITHSNLRSTDTTSLFTGLKYNTTYFWQVTARTPSGVTAKSDVWSFQTAAFPNNRFVFARTINGNTDIYSSEPTAAEAIRLTYSLAVETAPQFSPIGNLIAYTSNASGQYQLYTMNRDGSNQQQISTLSVEGYNNAGIGFRWSPDGAQLIYSHYDQLYRINRDGTGLTLLATAPVGRHFRECDWTAQNGGHLLAQTIGSNPFDSEIYLLNADGSNPSLLVSNLPGRVDSPSFSIDGTKFMYTRDIAGLNATNGRQLDAHIFIQSLTSTSATDISAATSANNGKAIGTNDIMPRFSSDGYHVLFVNRVNDDLSSPDVWRADIDGLNRTRLFTNAFLPDNK